MTKKRDPIVAVLDYFETAELALAQQALALAQAAVRKRAPLNPKPAAKGRSQKRSASRSVAEQNGLEQLARPVVS